MVFRSLKMMSLWGSSDWSGAHGPDGRVSSLLVDKSVSLVMSRRQVDFRYNRM